MTFSLPRTLRLALVFGTLTGAALVAPAQDTNTPPPGQTQGPPPQGRGGPRGGMNPERRVEMLQQRLNLSTDQTAQVRTILADGRAKMEASRADASTPQQDRRAQMGALMQAENMKIRSVLTGDQVKKYDDMLAEMRERRRDDRGGPAGSGPPPPPQ